MSVSDATPGLPSASDGAFGVKTGDRGVVTASDWETGDSGCVYGIRLGNGTALVTGSSRKLRWAEWSACVTWAAHCSQGPREAPSPAPLSHAVEFRAGPGGGGSRRTGLSVPPQDGVLSARLFSPRQSTWLLQERRPGHRPDRLAPRLRLHQHHARGARPLSARRRAPSFPRTAPPLPSPLALDQPSLALFSWSLEWM